MNTIRVSVSMIDDSTGEECTCGDLAFEPFDFVAVSKNPLLGLPQWKRLPLASDENLEVFASFEADSAQLSLQIRDGSKNVAAVMCDALQYFKFCSPRGRSILLACEMIQTTSPNQTIQRTPDGPSDR